MFIVRRRGNNKWVAPRENRTIPASGLIDRSKWLEHNTAIHRAKVSSSRVPVALLCPVLFNLPFFSLLFFFSFFFLSFFLSFSLHKYIYRARSLNIKSWRKRILWWGKKNDDSRQSVGRPMMKRTSIKRQNRRDILGEGGKIQVVCCYSSFVEERSGWRHHRRRHEWPAETHYPQV